MNWQQLNQSPEGASIELKGFLFQAPDGRWILSSESGLKSCCVGSPHKKASQITLDGDFSQFKLQQLIKAKGILQCQEQGWHLAQASGHTPTPFPFWTVLLIASVLAGAWLLRRFKRC